MTDLPLGVRTRLAERYGDVRPEPLALRVADEGATVKALFSPGYEVVAMRYRGASSRACADEEQHVRPGSSDRRTACVSSQAGCGLGCTFCATGQMGLVRSLEPFEIVQQVLWAADVLGGTVTNVVFMGMGEPLANYEASLAAIRSIHDDVGISARKVVLSTVGLVPAMLRLAEEPLPVTLALSLHAPDDETRSRLVPVGVRWPVAECMEAAHAFRGAHGRRVTIEYALIAEVNDHRWQAEMLAGLLRGTDMHVNLIPLNPTAGFPAHASARVEEFAAELKAGGVNVTVRDTRGREIDAACGQLASRAPRKMERAGST
ncbi:MAG: radical SAM protein [Acidobacteria bacterium]|nr:radical SAM protein [Acidobacteriota bacterium]